MQTGKNDQLPELPLEERYSKLLKDHAEVVKERDDLRDELATVKVDNQILKDENFRYSGINQQYQVRVSKLERTVQNMNNREMRLNFTALQGRLPILWIKAAQGAIDHKQFARIQDSLKRFAPGIDMVLFTEGQTDLYELDDEALNKMGLARISDMMTEKPAPTKQLETLPEAGDERKEG